MTKTLVKPKVTQREVGERVDVICSIEPQTVKDLGNGVFEATITTGNKDRTNESIVTDGVDPASWEKTGMPVLYGHDYEGLPIGKGLSFKKFKNKMTARFELAVNIYPFAATVAEMIKGGFLNAVSIGGMVKQWSEDYLTIEEMEMVEFSVVPVPANADAIITSRALEKATGKTIDQVRREYRDFTQKVFIDNLAELDDNELNKAVDVLDKLTAALKGALQANSTGKSQPKEVQRILHITIRDSAKAVNTQSQNVIKLIKLKGKSDE